MKEINSINISAPIKIGDILIKNILNTDINIIATKNVEVKWWVKEKVILLH